MSEIADAAERRRKHQEARVSMESPYYDPQLKEPWPYSRQLDKDAAELSDAYLAEHPADVATPLDEKALKRFGASNDEHPSKWTFCREDAMPIGLWLVDDGWKLMLIHSPNHASCIVRGIKTVGQLRSLASVLGIPLTGDV